MNRRSLLAAVPGLVVVELEGDRPVAPEPAGFELAPDERHLLALVNSLRAEHGQRPLLADPRLQEVARGRAARMSVGLPLSHDLPVGGTLYDLLPAVGLTRGYSIGECISVAEPWYLHGAVAETNMDKFAKSPPHLTALLTPWINRAGTASAAGEAGLYSVVVLGYLPG